MIGLQGTAARGAGEEIQIFLDDVARRGGLGLELHSNYVLSGSAVATYPGEGQSTRRLRLTPELSFGIGRGWQVGALAPLATLDRTGHLDLGGAKATIKYIVPSRTATGLWYGVNLEIGRSDRRLDVNPWNAELTAIAGTRRGPWLFAVNLASDIALAGSSRGPADLTLGTKVTRIVGTTLALGMESYNGAGDVKAPGRFKDRAQSLFVVADVDVGRWAVNVGLGRGYGANGDRWLIKAVIGVPLPSPSPR